MIVIMHIRDTKGYIKDKFVKSRDYGIVRDDLKVFDWECIYVIKDKIIYKIENKVYEFIKPRWIKFFRKGKYYIQEFNKKVNSLILRILEWYIENRIYTGKELNLMVNNIKWFSNILQKNRYNAPKFHIKSLNRSLRTKEDMEIKNFLKKTEFDEMWLNSKYIRDWGRFW